MSKILFIVLSFWAFAFAASATEVKETSANGVNAWYVEDKSLPVVAIKIAFKHAGYAHDIPNKSGLAYFTASMMNEGASKRDSKTFQQLLEENAISYAPDVDADNFYITIKTLSRNLDLTLELLNDSLTKLHSNQPDFERVRGQTLSLLAKRSEDPGTVASEKFMQVLFRGHSYAQTKEGEIQTVKKLTAQEIKDFTKKNFTKDNLVISIAGDVDAGLAKNIINKISAGLPEKHQYTALPPFTNYPNAQTARVYLPNPQTVVIFGFEGIPRQDKEFFAAYLLNHIIGGGGFQSRLMKEVREKRGLAYGISTDLADMNQGTMFYGTVATESSKASNSVAILKSEIANAVNGVTEKELADAKKFVIGSFPLNLDSNSRLASFVMTMQLNEMGIDYLNRRKSLMESVTLEDINRVAKRLLQPGKLVVVTVGN